MPTIENQDLTNLYEEIDKANNTIHTLSTAITEEEDKISILKKHRVILGIVSALLLMLLLWSFYPKSHKIEEEYLIKNNLSLINTDTLHNLKLEVDKLVAIDTSNVSINDLPIVYNVQIGAFNNFASNLFSEDFSHLSEFEQDGMSKFAIGNYATYREAVILRKDLRRLGFEDCFIIARSFGEPIEMKEALELSGEKWIRGE